MSINTLSRNHFAIGMCPSTDEVFVFAFVNAFMRTVGLRIVLMKCYNNLAHQAKRIGRIGEITKSRKNSDTTRITGSFELVC